YFIPICKPVNSPTSTPSSKASSRRLDPCAILILPWPAVFSVPPSARRVMRAWWSARSSKPLPRHDVSGGRFDSYPLRQLSGIRNHFRWEVIPYVAGADFQADCVVILLRLSFETQPAGSDAGSASATDPE